MCLYSIYYKHIRSDRSDSKVDFHNFTTISLDVGSTMSCEILIPLSLRIAFHNFAKVTD